MMKILVVILTLMLLMGCGHQPLAARDVVPQFLTTSGVKCSAAVPNFTVTCSGDVTRVIKLDSNGAPISVDSITTCYNKKVTWTYENDFPAGDAPPFAILFNPSEVPGNPSSVKVWSKPVNSDKNQEFTLQTKRVVAEDLCINYDVYIPEKGILDPVFLIDR
jgi:hypothetical protein